MNQVSNAGLIAQVLGCGNLEAEGLLEHVGGLAGLTKQSNLVQLPKIAAALELASRIVVAEMQQGEMVNDCGKMKQLARRLLRHEPHEVFLAMFFTTQLQLIAAEKLFFGTIDSASVHPREIVRRCLDHGCGLLAIAHNHPAGNTTPSHKDKAITKRIQDAMDLIDVRVIDHIIVGGPDTYSFAEHGQI